MDRKTGEFEHAYSSTVFLDEIGELPLAMQVKLLRFLQQGAGAMKIVARLAGKIL